MANDIEFSVGLDISDLERKVNAAQEKMNKLGGRTRDVPLAAFNANNLGSGTTQAGSNLYEFQSLKSKYSAAISEMKELMASGYEGFAKMAAENAAKYKGAIDAMKASAQAESADPFKSILKDLNSQKSQAKYGSLSTSKFDRVTEQEASIQSYASYLNRQKEAGIYGSLTTTKYDVDDLADFNAYADKLNKIKSQRIDGKLDNVSFSSKADEEIFNFADKLNKMKSARKDGDLYLDTVTGKYDALDKQEDKSEVTQSEITDETKAQNKEYNEHYIKLSKLHKLLLAILAVWKSMQKIAAAVVNRASEVNENLGFFSVDRQGAFGANVDKTRAMVYAGMRNMGKTNPLSKSDYDAVATRMQDARTAALTGKGIDKDYATAMQILNQKWGLGMSAAELYTKGDVNLTEIENRDLEKIENEVLPALARMPALVRDQMTNYLQTVYGDNVMNALMANRNLRDSGADIEALITRLLTHGENEMSNVNVSKYASELADSFSELKESWRELGDILLQDFFPAIKAVIGGLKAAVDWLRDRFHWEKEELRSDDSMIWGSAGNINRRGSQFYRNANNAIVGAGDDVKETQNYIKSKKISPKQMAKDLFAKAERNGSLNIRDAYQAMVMSADSAQSGYFAEQIESAAIDQQLRAIYNLYQAGALSTDKYSSVYGNVDVQGELGSLAAKNLGLIGKGRSYEDFIDVLLMENNLGGSRVLKSAYGQQGKYDFNPEQHFDALLAYITQGLSKEQEIAAISELAKTMNLSTTGGKLKIDPVDVKGGVELNIIMTDTKGTTTKQRFDIPMTASEAYSQHLKAQMRVSQGG